MLACTQRTLSHAWKVNVADTKPWWLSERASQAVCVVEARKVARGRAQQSNGKAGNSDIARDSHPD